jgi:hypothetical protein
MPSLHAHTLPASAPTTSPRSPSTFGVRTRVLLHRGRLDAQLAGGAAAHERPELALRAGQLTSERNRRELAETIERLVRVAHGTAARRSSSPPLARRDVCACSRQLMDLARLLRARPEVSASGVVLIERLITDGTGPLYVYGENDALWQAVCDAGVALIEARS